MKDVRRMKDSDELNKKKAKIKEMHKISTYIYKYIYIYILYIYINNDVVSSNLVRKVLDSHFEPECWHIIRLMMKNHLFRT